ncbi:MAG: glycosyltransferase family 2 protein [Bacteroidales bacterium]|nr:glycosyltransferase family 2 protein [Bacteroidales bacterium]
MERCLWSVINQLYENIESILVDDCSADDSIAKCERLIEGYNGPIKFRILHHEQNRGLSAARNTGTDAASGVYLYYLDSDDEITPDCIEKLVSYVCDDDSIQMVQGRYQMKGDGKEALGKSDEKRLLSNDEVREQFLRCRKLNYTVWNKLVKRSFIIDNGLYNKEGIINEDLLWTFYLIKHLNNAQLCNDVTYYYHIRPGSILTGGSKRKKGQSYVVIFNEILNYLTPGKEREELKGYQSTFCSELANYLRVVPELKPIIRLYKRQAKQYGCWSVYFTIITVAFLSRFCNPMGILKRLNDLREIVLRGK